MRFNRITRTGDRLGWRTVGVITVEGKRIGQGSGGEKIRGRGASIRSQRLRSPRLYEREVKHEYFQNDEVEERRVAVITVTAKTTE
jgi:hypothetical protein